MVCLNLKKNPIYSVLGVFRSSWIFFLFLNFHLHVFSSGEKGKNKAVFKIVFKGKNDPTCQSNTSEIRDCFLNFSTKLWVAKCLNLNLLNFYPIKMDNCPAPLPKQNYYLLFSYQSKLALLSILISQRRCDSSPLTGRR